MTTTPRPVPRDADPLPGELIEGLELLQELCRAMIPERPEGLSGLKAELEALRAESEKPGRRGIVRALERLILMTEVWDCLAVERPEGAREAATFLIEALGRLAAGPGGPPGEDPSSWVLRQSSARWSDYIALLDPVGDGEQGGADDPDDALPEVEAPPPEIDASTLLRMLTGESPAPRTPAPGRPTARVDPPHAKARAGEGQVLAAPPSEPVRRAGSREGTDHRPPSVGRAEDRGRPADVPSAPTARLAPRIGPTPDAGHGPPPKAAPGVPAATMAAEIDPDCREAFLSEALDLFERIESLVVALTPGHGHGPALDELGRCFHTLKGAAGSVGLIELASRVHFLEEQLEGTRGAVSPELLDRLHQTLSHLESLLEALKGGSCPAPVPASEATPARGAVDGPGRPTADRPEPATAPATATGPPIAEDARPEAQAPAPATEPADGPVRVPSGRIDELMDLASELIVRRGTWTAQADKLKQIATQIRAGRNELMARLDHLNDLGVTRAARAALGEVVGRTSKAATPRPGGAFDPPGDFPTAVLRLAEQAEDLVVLTEAAQAQVLPLTDDSDGLARLTLQLWETLQSIRIVPVRGLFQRLSRVARDAARVEGREVEVVMIGEETGLDRAVQDKAFEPLLHVVRNAVGHGIEAPDDRVAAGKAPTGRMTLEASREGNTLVLSVQDDGRGLNYDAIAEKGRRLGLIGPDEAPTAERLGALIFVSGFSTRQEANAISGRGVGMDVVAQEVRRLRGTIDLTSRPGEGTRISLRLPARLALEQALIARVGGQSFAIPVGLIEHAQAFDPSAVEGSGVDARVRVLDRRVPLVDAREALGFSATGPASCPKLLLVRAEGEALALVLDALEGTRELVIKPLGPLLAGHPVIWGTSLSLTGDVIFVLDPAGLLRRLREGRGAAATPDDAPAPRADPVLVVDDSISVRRVVTRQLRSLGFEVEEVSNGIEALGKLSSRSYSLVLTDLEMPKMDGFELLSELRRSPGLASLPVIVASTESRPATRRKALALGAQAFVPKPIDQDELARVAGTLLNRAIGRPCTIH